MTHADLREFVDGRVVIIEGGLGTMLQEAVPSCHTLELMNVEHADTLLGVHRAYAPIAEAMGERVSGSLELTEEALILASSNPESEKAQKTWPLLDIRAVQTSSSSLQFSPVAGGLMELRFPHDSPFRWEGLLRNALRKAYAREGRGRIVEFQPRIVTE